MRPIKNGFLIAVFILLSNVLMISAQEKSSDNVQELADKLANPVSNLISVPFQNNIDYGIGPYNGSKFVLNIQPVVPLRINSRVNLITRYIIPIVDQRDITGEQSRQTGLSDATISGFFTPAESQNGFTWGAGPVFLVPIGTENFLSTRKWGAGPTALVLKQSKGLTYGFLVNQIWSFAGDDNRSDISQMFLQPFVAHNFKSGAGISMNAELIFNWEDQTTGVTVNPTISGVTQLGRQTVSLGVGPRISFGPNASRADFGLRATVSLVFPR